MQKLPAHMCICEDLSYMSAAGICNCKGGRPVLHRLSPHHVSISYVLEGPPRKVANTETDARYRRPAFDWNGRGSCELIQLYGEDGGDPVAEKYIGYEVDVCVMESNDQIEYLMQPTL